MQLQQLAEGIFIINNFLSRQECKQLLAKSEQLGYKAADVDVHGQRKMLTMIRTNERVDMESPALALRFWQRLMPLRLPELNGESARGLTPFFRFYRYQGEQKFNMHKDGSKEYEGRYTGYTLLIYLNDLEKTGATHFRDADLEVFPETGKALLFEHQLWHAGMPVANGVKYVLRTDVIY